MKVLIGELVKDGLQTRVALDERTVAEYAEAMREGSKFPPVKVFEDALGSRMWLADGFHRVEAAMRAGRVDIEAEITTGTFVDALRWALGCNSKHGKRVTNEDKQNAMGMAWEHRVELFGGDPSASLLAEACGVHRNTAAAFVTEKLQMTANAPVEVAQFVQPATPQRPVRKVVGTDGKSYPARPQRPMQQNLFEPPAVPAHVVPTDCYDVEIPTNLQAAFDDEDTLRDITNRVSEARCLLRRGGPALAAVRQEALVHLDNAYNFIKAAFPHCVCRMCQGQGCKACHGRGWQTEEEYERNPADFKFVG